MAGEVLEAELRFLDPGLAATIREAIRLGYILFDPETRTVHVTAEGKRLVDAGFDIFAKDIERKTWHRDAEVA